MRSKFAFLLLFLLILSCSSKKDVLYLQDAQTLDDSNVILNDITIQPNDILKITVGSLVPEAAIPYNKISSENFRANTVDIMKLEGYVVSNEQTIEYPVLGSIPVANMTTNQLALDIKKRLEAGGHLTNPSVDVRLLNSKFTVLGEVKNPGTFDYTDTNLTVLQALGMAGDLSINGKRDDVVLIREVDNKRKISHINLKSADWLNTDLYQIRPNDVIIVNPNEKVVNSSGLVDVGTVLVMASLALSVAILLTR